MTVYLKLAAHGAERCAGRAEDEDLLQTGGGAAELAGQHLRPPADTAERL